MKKIKMMIKRVANKIKTNSIRIKISKLNKRKRKEMKKHRSS